VSDRAKRPFVRRLFTGIAPRYDWFNRIASCGLDQRWRRAVIARAQVQAGHRVLDACSGTGDLALLCAARQPAAVVVGLDFTPAMLARAQRKQRRRGAAVGWVQGDAESLPLATGSVDRVLIGFSTRNLSDLAAGVREMLRVLRPGGRLLILETGYPANRLVRWGYHTFLFTTARGIGWLLTGRCWPFTYLARSVRQFLTPQELSARLRSAGAQVEYVPLSGGLASLYIATKPS